MSDTTKKSIVINKSFLSGSDNSGTTSTIQNKKSRKNARILSEEIIRPNKLKKMLLDKINAKRKADYGSYNNGQSGNNSVTSAGISITSKGSGIREKENSLDITKESKLFSNEFKKSLDFLDSYIGQRVNSSNNKKNKNKSNAQNTPIINVCMIKIAIKNSLILFFKLLIAAKIQRGEIKVVSKTKNIETPSTPILYETKFLIQADSSTN